MQDLLAGRIGRQQQRGQGEGRDQSRHQHRRETLQRATHDHGLAEGFPLDAAQVDVVADLEDAVACGNAGQRDEAHHGGHRQAHAGQPHGDHAANERQRDVRHDDAGQHGRAVARVKHQEHHRQRDQRQPDDELRRLLLSLELPFQTDEAARRQGRLVDHLADVTDHAAHVRAIGVGVDHDAAPPVLPTDLVGAVGFFHRCEAGHGQAPGGRVHQCAGQVLRAAPVVGQAQHQLVALVAIDQLRAVGAIGQGLQHADGLAGRKPCLRQALRVQAHHDLRDQHLLFHRQVHQARDARQTLSHLLGQATQGVGVVPVDLHSDLRPHPGQQVIQPVRNRLADGHLGRQRRELSADLGHHLLAVHGLAIAAHVHIDLGRVHALGMFVHLGAAGAASDLGHPRYVDDELLGQGAHAVGLGQ